MAPFSKISISEIFVNDNNLNSVLMALMGSYYIIATDTLLTCTAVAHKRIFFIKAHTFACYCTRRFADEPFCV